MSTMNALWLGLVFGFGAGIGGILVVVVTDLLLIL